MAAALPRMLAEIATEIADVKVSAVEKWRLRQRAEMVSGLLTGGRSTYPALVEIATSGSARAPPVWAAWPGELARGHQPSFRPLRTPARRGAGRCRGRFVGAGRLPRHPM